MDRTQQDQGDSRHSPDEADTGEGQESSQPYQEAVGQFDHNFRAGQEDVDDWTRKYERFEDEAYTAYKSYLYEKVFVEADDIHAKACTIKEHRDKVSLGTKYFEHEKDMAKSYREFVKTLDGLSDPHVGVMRKLAEGAKLEADIKSFVDAHEVRIEAKYVELQKTLANPPATEGVNLAALASLNAFDLYVFWYQKKIEITKNPPTYVTSYDDATKGGIQYGIHPTADEPAPSHAQPRRRGNSLGRRQARRSQVLDRNAPGRHSRTSEGRRLDPHKDQRGASKQLAMVRLRFSRSVQGTLTRPSATLSRLRARVRTFSRREKVPRSGG